MKLNAVINRYIKWWLARTGRGTISLDKYGYDAFRDIQRLSKKWQHPIDIFFDVGANRGQTVRKVRNNWSNCRIIAFEPHPKTFAELSTKMKDFCNVKLVNRALGSEIGDKTMFEYEIPNINSLVPNAQFSVRFNKSAKSIPVACTTVDEFCSEEGIGKIDVLKIDTEGYELDVLKGSISMLDKRAIKFIYFEFNDMNPRLDASGGALVPIDEWIGRRGYRFIATYNDYVETDGDLFQVSNALYVLPPR